MKKNIYFLINSLEWWWAERSIITMASRLKDTNNVTLITLKSASFYVVPEGVEHIALSSVKNNLIMVVLMLYYIFSLRKILHIRHFDAGMSSLEIANFVHILSRKDANIAFETSMWFFWGLIGFFYRLLIRLLYPRAWKIKVNSMENKYSLAKYLKIDDKKISVIYNPLDEGMVTLMVRESCDDGLISLIRWKKVFITVARLIESKYHDKIIDSFLRVANQGQTDWVYLIVWDGKERKKLEQKVNNIWLSGNIIFLGAQKNVFKYLAISQYFVYASKIEWFPNVLGEAMACNLPIITSDFKTGARECIFGTYSMHDAGSTYPYYGPNGVLLDLDDYEDQFLEVYKNLEKLTQKKEWFHNFSMDTVQKNIIDFLLS